MAKLLLDIVPPASVKAFGPHVNGAYELHIISVLWEQWEWHLCCGKWVEEPLRKVSNLIWLWLS